MYWECYDIDKASGALIEIIFNTLSLSHTHTHTLHSSKFHEQPGKKATEAL